MKKSILLSLVMLALYFPINAQLSFGIEGGINSAWHSGNNGANMQGLNTSLLLYKRVGKFLEIGIEPGLVQRGTSENYSEHYYDPFIICCFGDCEFPPSEFPDNPYRGLRASYLKAPVMARATFPLAQGKLALLGKIGGGPSFLTGGYHGTFLMDDATFIQYPETKKLDFSNEATSGTNRWDWGLYGGAGLGYPMGFGMLSFTMEYYRGMTAVSDYQSGKNRGISYAFGFSVNL